MLNKTENRIKSLLREFQEEPTRIEGGLQEETPKPAGGEADSQPKKQSTDKGDLKAKHERVAGLLKNDVFNHAGVIRRLWGDSEASNRSLFKKKLERQLNDNGNPYEFDDEELSKIVNILMDTSKQVTSTFGG